MKIRSKKPKTRKKPKSKKPRKKARRNKTTALVKAPAPQVPVRRAGLRPDQVQLLKRTVAKGTTDDEFALFLWVAKKHKLDPMTRQLHAVKRFSRAEGRDVMTVQIGIDGYRSLAARNHKDYGGIDEAEYEYNPDGSVKLARVRLWKKGFEHATVGVAYWDEFAPADLNEKKAFFWAKMPKHMLGKCAEALALRKAYPDLADIYTDEEMAQADSDYSEEGRPITVDGKIPSEQQIVEKPEYRKQFSPAGGGTAALPPAPAKVEKSAGKPRKKILHLTWVDQERSANVQGDTYPIREVLKTTFQAKEVREGDKHFAWNIEASLVPMLVGWCSDNDYTLKEHAIPLDRPKQKVQTVKEPLVVFSGLDGGRSNYARVSGAVDKLRANLRNSMKAKEQEDGSLILLAAWRSEVESLCGQMGIQFRKE